MTDRHLSRTATQQQANADLLGLALTEYLALSRRERKRRLKRARDNDAGWNWQRTAEGGWYSGPPRPDTEGDRHG